MDKEQQQISIADVYQMMKQGQLRVPAYQREFVWSISQQELLIDSIMQGIYVGQMFIAKGEQCDSYDIIDGQQRIKTICNFIDNNFQINTIVFDESQREEFLNKKLHFFVLNDVISTEKITEVFRLINTAGEPLTAQEIRRINAKGNFAETVKAITNAAYPQKTNATDPSPHGLTANIWKKFGVLSSKELKQGADEVLISRILLAIIQGHCQPHDEALLDEVYKTNSDLYKEIEAKLEDFPISALNSRLEEVFSLLTMPMADIYKLSKECFYISFLSLYDLLVEGAKVTNAASLSLAFSEINQLVPPDTISKKQYFCLMDYAKFQITQKCIAEKVGDAIGINELEAALYRAKVETAGYEFKQGILFLDEQRNENEHLMNAILETICGMANSCLSGSAYLFIGIADKKQDALRIAELDHIKPAFVADHYIVGIEREARALNISVEGYCRRIKNAIDTPKLSKALALSVLPNIDIVRYRNLSVLRIEVPPQNEISYYDGKVYIRKHSNTEEVTSACDIVAIANRFFHKMLQFFAFKP